MRNTVCLYIWKESEEIKITVGNDALPKSQQQMVDELSKGRGLSVEAEKAVTNENVCVIIQTLAMLSESV